MNGKIDERLSEEELHHTIDKWKKESDYQRLKNLEKDVLQLMMAADIRFSLIENNIKQGYLTTLSLDKECCARLGRLWYINIERTQIMLQLNAVEALISEFDHIISETTKTPLPKVNNKRKRDHDEAVKDKEEALGKKKELANRLRELDVKFDYFPGLTNMDLHP